MGVAGFEIPDNVRDGALLTADDYIGSKLKRPEVVATVARLSILEMVVDAIADKVGIDRNIIVQAAQRAAADAAQTGKASEAAEIVPAPVPRAVRCPACLSNSVAVRLSHPGAWPQAPCAHPWHYGV